MENQNQEPTQQSMPSNNLPSSTAKLSLEAYQVAMATLASATRCKPFSREDCLVWYRFLGDYDDDVLAEAVDTFCRGIDPFPIPGKLIAICKQILKYRQEAGNPLRIGRRTGPVDPIPYPGTWAADMLAEASSLPDEVQTHD